jgi:hypothetical protein
MTSNIFLKRIGCVSHDFCSGPSLTIVTRQSNLLKEMTYDLIQGHGRTHIYLFYATTIGDYERVVEHWILEEDWVKAIDVISRQVTNSTILSPKIRLMLHASLILNSIIALDLFSCIKHQRKLLILGCDNQH